MLVSSLIDTDRLIKKKLEGGGSSDVGDDIFDTGLEILVKQETFCIVIEFQGFNKGLEFGFIGSG